MLCSSPQPRQSQGIPQAARPRFAGLRPRLARFLRRRASNRETVPMLNRRNLLKRSALAGVAGLALPGSLLAAGPEGHRTHRHARLDQRHRSRRPARRARRPEPGLRQDARPGVRPRHAGLPAGRHLCRLQHHPAARRAAERRAGRDAHRLWRRRPSDGRGRRRAYRTDRRWCSTAPTAGWATTRRACSTCAASHMLVIDNCQIVGSGKNGLSLERVGGRIERTTISGAADAGIYSVEATGLGITGNTVSDCANGGILVHRWQVGRRRHDGHRQPRRAHLGAQRRHRPVRQRHQRLPRRQGASSRATSSPTAPSRPSAPTAPATCRSPATPARRSARPRSTPNSPSRAPSSATTSSTARPTASRSSTSTRAAARPSARAISCATSRPTGPYPADAPGFGVGISVEADTTVTGNMVENAPLYGIKIGWGPYMRNVVATGNVIRAAPHRHRRHRRRGRRAGGHLRQCHRRRHRTAPSSATAGRTPPPATWRPAAVPATRI